MPPGRGIAAGLSRHGRRGGAARRLKRVLTNDPALGVYRHADAGYETAVKCAREEGMTVPMA